MKNAALIFTALLALLSVPAFGQTPSVGNLSVGFGAEGGVPSGDLKNVSDFGIGGLGWVAFQVDPSLTVTGKVGYQSFSAKAGGNSRNIIPILVGGRYFLTPDLEVTSMRSYVAADAGLYSLSVSGGGSSSTKFGIAPALGAQFGAGPGMKIDLHVNYSVVFTELSNTSWIGFGAGLEFGM